MGVKLREKTMKDGSSSLYLDIYHEGKRKYDFLNIHLSNKRKFSKEDKEKRELAERLRIKKDRDLFEKEIVSFDKKKSEENFYTFFNKVIKEENKTYAYWGKLLKKIKQFSEKNENLKFSSITEDWIIEFQKYLLKTNSANTGFLYMRCLIYILKEAKRKNIIEYNPMDAVPREKRIKRETVEKTYLTIKEIEKLYNIKTEGIKTEYLQIFLFCCFTGLRWSDVHGLKWSNILKTNKESEKVISFKQKKTKQLEYLPLSKQVIKILDELENENNQYVFHQIIERIKKSYSDNVLNLINASLKIWAKEIRLNKNLHFHVSRHTFATMSLTNGVDLYTVSKLLGHSDINTTTIYAKVVNEKKTKAIANLPKLNFNKIKN